jgi:hypothetical protein
MAPATRRQIGATAGIGRCDRDALREWRQIPSVGFRADDVANPVSCGGLPGRTHVARSGRGGRSAEAVELSILDALDEAVAAGLLTEAGHGDYAFAHALVRDTIYGQLGSARRIRLHRQLGEALEALEETDAHVEALAYHFAQAAADGQGAKAADYALAAGRHAIDRLGYAEAAAHYERGLQALGVSGQPQEQRRCELLLALGEARWGDADLEQARRAYEQAAELVVVPEDVVHPGLFGGWLVSKPPVPRRTPDEVAR